MKRLLSRRQCLPLLAAGLCPAAETPVSAQWRRIAAETDGTVGAMAVHLTSGRTASLHGDERFPLASVCKLPIAAHILAMVDEGRLSLDEELTIPRYDVWPGVSVVAERWPKQRRFRLDELVEWMVAKSDNTAVQTLFGLAAVQRRWPRAFGNGGSMGYAWIAASGNARSMRRECGTLHRCRDGCPICPTS